jgi:hypothetical protein
MARPRKEIDAEQVFRMAKRGCTQSEIAGHFGVSQSTISGRFRSEFELGSAESKTSLRALQFRRAAKGDTKMLIHLGMVYLGQKQAVDVTSGHKPITYVERACNPRDARRNGVAPQSAPETVETDRL